MHPEVHGGLAGASAPSDGAAPPPHVPCLSSHSPPTSGLPEHELEGADVGGVERRHAQHGACPEHGLEVGEAQAHGLPACGAMRAGRACQGRLKTSGWPWNALAETSASGPRGGRRSCLTHRQLPTTSSWVLSAPGCVSNDSVYPTVSCSQASQERTQHSAVTGPNVGKGGTGSWAVPAGSAGSAPGRAAPPTGRKATDGAALWRQPPLDDACHLGPTPGPTSRRAALHALPPAATGRSAGGASPSQHHRG